MRAQAWITTLLGALLVTTPVQAEPWRAGLEAFAKAHFRHPAWGWQHSRRDYNLARDLARADGVMVDDDVLFAAAFIHDIAAFVPWEDEDPSHDHSDVGAAKLGDVLLGLRQAPRQSISTMPMRSTGWVRSASRGLSPRSNMAIRRPTSPTPTPRPI